MKRWRLVAAAALGVGAAGCTDRPLGLGELRHDASTLSPVDAGQGSMDAGVDFSHPSVDLSHAPVDMRQPSPHPDYGPAIIFSDLSVPADGGTE
jgi:hypothetical protein